MSDTRDSLPLKVCNFRLELTWRENANLNCVNESEVRCVRWLIQSAVVHPDIEQWQNTRIGETNTLL